MQRYWRLIMTDLIFDTDGPVLAREGDVNDFISAGWDAGADRLVIPVSRLSPDFFKLSTGLAGAVLQKCSNYSFRVVIVGDISTYTEKSGPLRRDFVYESRTNAATSGSSVRLLAEL